MKNRRFEAWRSENLFVEGMGYVVVARFKGSGAAELGVFLLDTCCLGVKNAFYTVVWSEEYEGTLDRIFAEQPSVKVSPESARKLVEDSVAYAQGFGLNRHPDYKQAARVFGGIDAQACQESFAFGREGKPLYVQGPNDSPAFVEHVLSQLRCHCGPDGYHFLILSDSGGGLAP
jgi:hypothetical protein